MDAMTDMEASLDALLGNPEDPFRVTDTAADAAARVSLAHAVSSAESDPTDALSFVFQVDCSPIRDEDDQPVGIFQHPRARMDVALDFTLVIGVDKALYIAQLPSTSAPAKPNARATEGKPTARFTLLGDGDLAALLEDDECITDVKWIDNERFAASFSSGILRVFHRDGRVLLAQKFHYASILKLDISPSVSTKVTGQSVREVDMHSEASASSPAGGELWVLYEDATVAIIQVQELLLRIRAAVYGPAQANKFRKYALRDRSDIVAVAPCGQARPTIFQSHPRLGVHTVISVGTGPFLSFYHAGNDQNSIIHLAHIATAIASRAAGAVWTFAKSWGWSSGAEAPDGSVTGDANASGEMRAVDAAAEHVAAPIGNTRAISEDSRRRCRMLVLSPTGRLAAISDTLGRILLVDTNRMTVIRMWKGYRYAQVGWMHGAEGKRRSRGLYLVIYSAQRGIVEVWRTRYGPRVFSFAVGNSARLFTHYNAQKQHARCVVLSGGAGSMTELIEVKSRAPSVPILMKYFTQNKLQEENFVLHQIIGTIQAYAKKKRMDASHTLEQDSIEPLLGDISSLSSPTSIQALLDVLLTPDMATLSASFVLKVLEKLQPTIRNGMASRSPTGTELTLLWLLQWRHRVLSAYIGLQSEFMRARNILLAATKDTSAVLAKHVAPDNETGSSRSRLVPWLELYRRAGHNWSEDNNEATRRSIQRASDLSWWEFLEFFSMPFTDPDLPRRRDIVALYDQTEKSENFLRAAFQVLNVPVLRSSIRQPHLATLMTFLFTPVLSNVFAVQELQQLHASVFLTPATRTLLFVEWYFSLPIGSIMAIPPPSLSCAFQRWLTPYFEKPDFEQDMEDDSRDEGVESLIKRRLSSCPQPLAQVFRACVRSQRLVHAFIFSEHCRWGEQQQSRAIEESTLGKYSSVDGGLRWTILQDCLAKTVHVALRLGRLGKVSVEGVENVDEIIRLVALMQLNEGYDLEDNDLAKKVIPGPENATAITGNGSTRAYDSWVASLEDCRTAAQMKNWLSVLHNFPQFADKDTLFCFRAALLCAAWNAERSDMHQLDDAINEAKVLSSSKLKVAMGVHIWEKYIRVHVVTLISFWEESAAGRKPQRGLQPQIARRFFSIIHGLLSLLIAALKEVETNAQASQNGHYEEVDEEDDEGDDGSDGEDTTDGEMDEQEQQATTTMESLTSRKRWSTPVRELRRIFAHKWPPSHSSCSLMQSLYDFPVDRVSSSRLADHLSLILLLDSFAATAVTPVSIVKLYPDNGRDLCRADSFMEEENRVSRVLSTAERRAVDKERTQFLRQLLHYDNALGFALAESFDLPTELIREEYIIFLYQSGKDEKADFALDKLKQPERLVPQLGSIARARLSLILQRMKAEVEFAMIMSILPADLFMWIIAEKLPPYVADKQVETLDDAPSLTGTSMMLLRCLSLMQPSGPEFEKMSAMSVLVKDIISRVKHQQQRPS